MSGRSLARRDSPTIRSATASRSTRRPPRTPSRSRARAVRPASPARSRGRPGRAGSRRRRAPRRGCRRARRATAGPNSGVPPQPDDELHAGRGHRLDEEARGRRGRAGAAISTRRAAAAGSPRRRPGPGGRRPSSLLWARSAASSLSATGPADRRGPPRRPRRHRRPRIARVTGSPASARNARLSRSERVRVVRVVADACPRAVSSCPNDVRSAASAGHSARRGPTVRAGSSLVRPLPARDRGDRAEGLDRAAQHRGAVAVLVEQRLDLRRVLARRERHVDRQDRRAGRASRPAAARVTSWAVSTSDGRTRYGKSWTSARTS